MSHDEVSGKRIVYLFNSAIRGTYKENLFRILALPAGCHVTLRYQIGQNVKEELLPHLKDNAEVQIVFINRYGSSGYEYLPIRGGVIKSIQVDAGQIYINCQLKSYCTTDDVAAFTEELQGQALEAPRLVGKNPEEPNDGQYALYAKSVQKLVTTSFNSWSDSVKYINGTKLFPPEEVAFVRIRVKGETEDRDVNSSGDVVINPLTRSYLEILYNDPAEGKGDKYIVVESQDPILLHRSKRRKLGSRSDVLLIPMVSRYRLDQAMSFMTVSVTSSGKDVYSLDVPIAVKPWPLMWLAGIFALVIIGADILPQFYKDNVWLGVVCSVAKWVLVVVLMALLGRMPNLPE